MGGLTLSGLDVLAWAPERGRRTKSRGPKGLQLEVGPRRGPLTSSMIYDMKHIVKIHKSDFHLRSAWTQSSPWLSHSAMLRWFGILADFLCAQISNFPVFCVHIFLIFLLFSHTPKCCFFVHMFLISSPFVSNLPFRCLDCSISKTDDYC